MVQQQATSPTEKASTSDQDQENTDHCAGRAGFNIPKHKGPTAQDVQDVHKLAYEEGYNEGKTAGYEAGMAQALAAGRAEIEAQSAKLKQMVRALMQPIQSNDREIRDKMLNIIQSLTQAVLCRELTIDQCVLVDLIEQSIKQMVSQDARLKISLAEADYDMAIDLIKKIPEYTEDWQIRSHPHLSSGALLVQSEDSASIETSVADIVESTLDGFYKQTQSVQQNFLQSNNTEN